MRPATVSSLLALTALASVPVSVPYYASPFTKPSQAHNTQMAQQTTQGAPREIDFPYYSLRDGYSSLLQLVSDSPVSLPIEVTIRSSSGRNILKKDMNISSQEKLMIELQSLVASLNGESEDDFQEGSISVSYASDTRPIMGQITVTNPYLNLIFESRLAINDPGDSNIPAVLEGIWWGLKPGRQTKVMVANTSNSSVTADVSLTFRGQRHLGALISFAPYETKVLSIRELLAKFNADTEFVSEGGITITGHSPSPVLIASGMTADLNSGFSTTMHFPPAGTPQTSTLLAPGVPIGTPSAESPFALAGTFTPHVVVRNLSSSPQTATVSVEYPTASGTQLITLDPINLAAYATKDVALDSTVQDRLPLPLPYCSIQVKNSGSPGSAVAEISSVAHNQDLVVDSKLGDPTDRLSGSGINPWHLDDQTESVLFLANEGDAPARVAFQIQAQRTKPDMFGNTIPARATDGSLFWVKMDRVPMIGRTLVFSSHKGISSNFDCSCTLHCPQGYLALSVAPSSTTMTINGTQQFTATERWGDCSGLIYYYDQTTSSTWTSNSSACTVGNNGLGSSGLATGVAPGSATIKASYTDDVPHWSVALQDCVDNYIQRSASGTANVVAVPTNFRQTSTSDLGNGDVHFTYAWGSTSGNLADLSACTVGEIVTYPGGNPYHWQSPPFPANSTSNPTVSDVAATAGAGVDDNFLYPSSTFVRPYSAASFTATQFFRYKCTNINGGNYVNLLGPLSITRSVQQNTNGTWRFTVTKPTNGQATINALP